jgi:uncharacterized iron-regulated membrane protein
MTNKAARRWWWVHKWSSLISTVFLLMLCITGLPLIFSHEIDHLLHEEVEPRAVPAGTPFAHLDEVMARTLKEHPGKAVQFISWDKDEPDIVLTFVGESPTSNPQENKILRIDAHTAEFLDQPDFESRLTGILFRLHVDMFAGLPGKLFLGLMGLLFVVALISGVVVYGPSMRKADFGTIRRDRVRGVRWLDLHNLIGIVALAWMLVVGFTGVINTWADLVLKLWQADQLADMLGQHKDKPIPAKLASVDAVVKTARETLPDMTPAFVAFPGGLFSSPGHYIVFMRGDAPVTSRLLKPVVIDGASGEFVDTRDMPWYVATLLLSQPLHFGDYGGMPLKILWALLDIFTIIVLVTGLYLWLFRRRSPNANKLIESLARGEDDYQGALPERGAQ